MHRPSEDDLRRLLATLSDPDADDVPRAALDWLRQVIRADFPGAAERPDDASGSHRRSEEPPEKRDDGT